MPFDSQELAQDKFYFIKFGGASFDKELDPATRNRAPITLKKVGNSIANNFVAKVKSVVSPYFGANDLALAYAIA